MMSDGVNTGTLVQLKLFQGERADALEWLLDAVTQRWLEDGEVLLEPEQENALLFILLEGTLRVELNAGERLFVSRIGRGECVGELSVLDGKPTAANVVAEGRCHLLCLEREVLWRLIDNSHAVARNLLYLLSSRIRQNDAALSDSFVLQQRYAHNARIDPLTGLYNRYWLDEVLPRLVERSRREGSELGLIMLDVDYFKRFNDSYGHLAGDEVLRELGAIIRLHLRADDSAIRYGGEEIVILLPYLPRERALDVAERLREAVLRQSSERLGSQGLPGVSVSVGVAMLQPGQTGKELIAAADAALYRAKHEGRNRVAIRA